MTTLTEDDLADEIRFVAGVAAKRATAVMHIGVVNMLVEQGMDLREARDFVGTHMPYATPEQAGEAELALIARHSRPVARLTASQRLQSQLSRVCSEITGNRRRSVPRLEARRWL